jgi:antitoxin (DNA-binding transcriptional repressor) of toxin-antitoxin stability system
MSVIGIRQLCRQTTDVFDELEKTGAPVVIARHGKPIAALIQIDESRMADLILASASEFVDDRQAADEALSRGDVQPMTEVMAELAAARESESAEPAVGALGRLVALAIGTPEYEQAIESVSRAAVESAPIKLEAGEAEHISAVNEGLTRALVAGAMWSAMAAALARVRRVNERVAQIAALDDAPASSYAQMLDRVVEAEELSVAAEIPSHYAVSEVMGGTVIRGTALLAGLPRVERSAPPSVQRAH